MATGAKGCAGWRGLLVAALAGLATGQPVGAAEGPCSPGDSEPATVRAIGDDLSLAFDDGRRVRLAGIDPARPTPTQPGWTRMAQAWLSSRLAGRIVLVRPLATATDRWGRLPALVFADPEPPDESGDGLSRSVALALVADGLARGRPEPETHGCWPAVLAAETAARQAGLGLWADPYYAVRSAEDLASLSALAGSMAIVQGHIAHMGQTRSQVFLDLGPPHAAVALRLPLRQSFILGQPESGQSGLVGTLVRARGVLKDRGGLRIDVDVADQVERLDGGATAR